MLMDRKFYVCVTEKPESIQSLGFSTERLLMVIYSRKLSGVSVLAIKIFLPTKRVMHR